MIDEIKARAADRLTARNDKGLAYFKKVKQDEQAVDSQYPNTLRAIFEGMQRLAEYEDKVPELISEVERLTKENERLKKQIRAFEHMSIEQICEHFAWKEEIE